ncbi:MAG: hypothetical protein QOH50_1015 [Kribbellaceae bacterium]|jgi:hypothetical protein|nr:hypothetical protein [Kribbellaceae bacterium]
MLTARTLAEAHVYASVMAAADATPPDATVESPTAAANLVEGPEAWTFTAGDIVVEIPYLSEQAARQVGARFGLGVSQLVDAGQWILVATTYARRALEADLAYTGEGPVQDRRRVELNWEFAADAVAEAVKFVPEDADEVPDEAVWSELGLQARRETPEQFTRAKLLDDLGYYRGTLDDFRALYGPPA